MRKLDKPVEQFGEQITEEVDTISFTGDGKTGTIGPGQFQDFGLSLGVPDTPGKAITFKAVQTYSNGEVVRWIGGPDSEQPAPQVQLTAAEEEEGAAAAPAEPAAPAAEADDDGGSDTLAIIALIVAVVGLLAALAALLGRRRERVGVS